MYIHESCTNIWMHISLNWLEESVSWFTKQAMQHTFQLEVKEIRCYLAVKLGIGSVSLCVYTQPLRYAYGRQNLNIYIVMFVRFLYTPKS